MDGREFKFTPGARVKLRDGVDPSFYQGMAKIGNEGWITQHRRDRFGLPEAYIQWDPNHWAYNRQPDGWTFEEHFELAEEADMDEQPPKKFTSLMGELFKQHFAPAPPAEPQRAKPKDPEEVQHDAQADEHFSMMVNKALHGMTESEAFVTVAVVRRPHPDSPAGELQVIIVGDSITPEADVLVGSQLSSLGAKFHQEAALLHIQHFTA